MQIILTKKSKLKRKRKYLVTLIQADPILMVLELPGRKKRRQVGQGQERKGTKLTGIPDPPTADLPRGRD